MKNKERIERERAINEAFKSIAKAINSVSKAIDNEERRRKIRIVKISKEGKPQN